MALQAHYKFDETSGPTFADSSGNGYDLTFSGSGTTVNNTSPGTLGKHVTFNGSGVMQHTPDTPYLNAGTVASVSVWFKTSTSHSTTGVIAYCTQNATSTTRFGFSFLNSKLRLVAVDSGGTASVVTTVTSYDDGAWHHAVGLCDIPNDTMTIYIDGSLASTTGTVAFPASAFEAADSGNIAIGAFDAVPNNRFTGAVDDVRFYDHLLDSTERAALYAMGSAVAVAITSPVQYACKQRNGSTVSWTVSGTYTGGTPAAIEYDLNDAGSWATLDASPSGGTFSGSVALASGNHKIAVRWSDDTDTTDTVDPVRVGYGFGWTGQSNASGRYTNAQTYTGDGSSIYNEDAGAWEELATGWGDRTDPVTTDKYSVLPILATLLEADFGEPIWFIHRCTGGASIVSGTPTWNEPSGTDYAAFNSYVSDSGINGLTALCYGQGEAEIIANYTNGATYQAAVEAMHDGMETAAGFTFPMLVEQTGVTETANDTAANAIRAAQIATADDNADVYLGAVCYDRAGLHYESDVEATAVAGRWFRAIVTAFFAGSGGSPRLTTATYSDDTITLTYDQTLAGATLDEEPWLVTDGAGTRTVSAAVASGRRVTLTVDQALADTVTVRLGNGDDAAGLIVPTNSSGSPAIAESTTATEFSGRVQTVDTAADTISDVCGDVAGDNPAFF